MIIPVRCQSCNKVLADKWEAYKRGTADATGANANEADADANNASKKTVNGRVMDKLDITRMCCRSTMLSHVDMLKNI